MTTADPDHVAVLTQCLHLAECPVRTRPGLWSQRHHDVHRRRAETVLSRLADAGYTLATTKETYE